VRCRLSTLRSSRGSLSVRSVVRNGQDELMTMVWKKGVGFWFAFQCENCTTSRRKIMVKYVTDYDFKIRGGDEEDVGDGRAEGDSVEWYGSGGGTG
jgi:hypothetical protein